MQRCAAWAATTAGANGRWRVIACPHDKVGFAGVCRAVDGGGSRTLRHGLAVVAHRHAAGLLEGDLEVDVGAEAAERGDAARHPASARAAGVRSAQPPPADRLHARRRLVAAPGGSAGRFTSAEPDLTAVLQGLFGENIRHIKPLTCDIMFAKRGRAMRRVSRSGREK